MAESKEELKSLLMKVREESEKASLKLNVKKIKIMASRPITSWQIDGETMETVTDFIFLGSIITADGDCSHEIKRHLLLRRKAMTNLDSILKNRDIILPTKVHLVKAMVFPVVMYGCASWSMKKAERRRIDAFELWCWGRLFGVPWTARRLNQSILKEIKSLTISVIYCHGVIGPGAMILIFQMLSVKSAFSPSSFTFIKRLYSSSLLFCHKDVIICISKVVDISPGNLDSTL